MHVEIITPEKVLFSDEATLIQLPGGDGLFEIMNNHAPIISSLKKGVIRIVRCDDKKYFFEITSGVVEFKSNSLIVLASNGIML